MAHLREVTIPLSLFERMADCYYGKGPRFSEREPSFHLYNANEPTDERVGQIPEEGMWAGGAGPPPTIADMIPRVRPIGMHERRSSDPTETEG